MKGKDRTKSDSYNNISLISCVGKLMAYQHQCCLASEEDHFSRADMFQAKLFDYGLDDICRTKD
ncbi:hypothetical protein DPMN_114053 [Dreissena polymorpha]|uniref:Uncharacterized protein n=1 Tax=Dreissena polymorpha TaxID=45954 RepID=A0A9D4QR78_DREPO|nr:hypothetical protein DPMN_114053 [Dreissena polymorpha]